MNAHTQFPEADAAIPYDDLADEIEQVELKHHTESEAETDASSIAAHFNNKPLSEKLRFIQRSMTALFALVVAASVMSFFGSGWTVASAVIDLAIAVAGIVWITVIIRAAERDFAAPLRHMIGESQRLARGARDIQFVGLDRQDEVGIFSRNMKFLLKAGTKIDELYRVRKQAEQERSDNQVQRKQELLNLAARFEANIAQVASGVATAADQLSSASSDLSKAADGAVSQVADISDAMEQVSRGTSSAASASDEFALSIEEISRQAASSAELARTTNEAAMETDSTVMELSDTAAGISQIAELIDSIAGRTNLLALNASIEAARGGESGRGFAVVASEVKELANQTSRATGDATSRISQMQQRADASVKELREISEQIHQLELAATSIASAVDQQSVAGKELALNVDMAANGVGEVTATTGQLRKAALDAGSSANQVLDASQELQQQAAMLKQEVADFLTEIRKD